MQLPLKFFIPEYWMIWLCTISVNRRDAGYAELDVTATSPLGKNLPIEVRPADDGEVIELTPAVAGITEHHTRLTRRCNTKGNA